MEITITGEGLAYSKKDISFSQAGQIIAFLDTENSISKSSPMAIAQRVPSFSTEKTLSDILNKSQAKTFVHKILVIGKFLQDRENRDSFLLKDIREELRKLGTNPKNFSREIRNARKDGYVYCKDIKLESYCITDAGGRLITSQFTEERTSKPRAKRKTTNKTNGGSSIRPEIQELEIVADMDGYLGYHDPLLLSKRSQILWILTYASSKGINELSAPEIVYLSNKLKDEIPSSGFSAHNVKNIKDSLISSHNGKFSIQHKGMIYLGSLAKNEK